jgi:hypothetical protein
LQKPYSWLLFLAYIKRVAMGAWFSKTKAGRKVPTNIDATIRALDLRAAMYETIASNKLKALQVLLKDKSNPNQRYSPKAKMAFKEYKLYVQHTEKMMTLKLNMIALSLELENQKVTVDVFAVMKQATGYLKEHKITISQAEELMDELDELSTDANEISGTFARPLGQPVELDEETWERELDSLLECPPIIHTHPLSEEEEEEEEELKTTHERRPLLAAQ